MRSSSPRHESISVFRRVRPITDLNRRADASDPGILLLFPFFLLTVITAVPIIVFALLLLFSSPLPAWFCFPLLCAIAPELLDAKHGAGSPA